MTEEHAYPTVHPGQWCHIEIPTVDMEKAKAFYGDVLGWTFQEVPHGEGTYTLYMTGDGGIGGGIWNPPEGMPRQVVNYVWVEELEPICKKVEAAGGSVLMPEIAVEGIGWLSLVADLDGNVFGLWKQGEHQDH